MPHTKLKVFSIILIIAGGVSLLAAVCVVIAALAVGELFVSLMVAGNLSEGMAKLLIVYTMAVYLASGAAELFAGIAGIRFSDGSIDEKFCRIPAIVLLVMFSLNLFLKLITWNPGGIVGGLLYLAVAGAYFVYVKKVEEYNRTRPSLEDMTLFHLRDEY